MTALGKTAAMACKDGDSRTRRSVGGSPNLMVPKRRCNLNSDPCSRKRMTKWQLSKLHARAPINTKTY